MSRAAPRPEGAVQIRERGQISTRQFALMLIAVIVSFTAAVVPSLVLQISKADGWLTVAVAWALDVALAVIYAHMGLRFPGKTFVEYATSGLGRWIGKPVGLMFPLFFLFVSAMLLYGLSSMLTSIFLPGTPVEAIAGAALVVVAYGARGGLEVLARASEVLVPFFVAILTLIMVVDLRYFQPGYLRPVLEHGPVPALQGVPLTLSFLAICIIMGMFQAYQNEPHRAWFAKFTGVSTGGLLIAGMVVVSAGVFGAEAAGSSRYPDLALARMVTLGEFVERMEPAWVATAVGAGVLSIAILLWAAALGVAQTLGLREYQPLVLPLAGLVLPLSLVFFANQSDHDAFARTIFPFYALTVEAGLAILIWLASLVRGKRGEGQSPGRVSEAEKPVG